MSPQSPLSRKLWHRYYIKMCCPIWQVHPVCRKLPLQQNAVECCRKVRAFHLKEKKTLGDFFYGAGQPQKNWNGKLHREILVRPGYFISSRVAASPSADELKPPQCDLAAMTSLLLLSWLAEYRWQWISFMLGRHSYLIRTLWLKIGYFTRTNMRNINNKNNIYDIITITAI